MTKKKKSVIGVRGQCFVPFFCSSFGKELVIFKCTQETMAFVQTSAKWLNFTNCAGTQTLIRLYYQSYLERRSWREKKFCMCEGVSCSLFWGRNFSASVEWCGAKKFLKHVWFCILTVFDQDLLRLWLGLILLLVAHSPAGLFQQVSVNIMRVTSGSPAPSACSTKVKNSCSLPANCNVSFKWVLLKRLWGQPRAAC